MLLKETGPATQSPSANAAGDEAARLFGEEAPGNYGVMGRLMEIKRLPVGDLGLLTVGFRITDRPGEKWTRRFNQFKYGEPTALRAATRIFCAAIEDFLSAGNPRVAGGQWLVIEGLHGQAKRTFNMTGEECVAYQKQVFKAIKANSIMGWIRFARWYGKWRPSASV